MQAGANGEVTHPRLNADVVGDLLALDDAPSTAGNASAAADMLADLLGEGGPGLSASDAVAGGSQVRVQPAWCAWLPCRAGCGSEGSAHWCWLRPMHSLWTSCEGSRGADTGARPHLSHAAAARHASCTCT